MAIAARTARSGSSSWTTGAPKSRHHRVADELLDRAAVALELRAEARMVRRQQSAHVLRVELFGPRGEADEVDEHDRDDLSLLARLRGLRDEQRAAHPAVPELVRILPTARRARRHGMSLGGCDPHGLSAVNCPAPNT
jgi:hypothetical protein